MATAVRDPDVELAHHRTDVPVDRASGQEERLGDLTIRQAPGHQRGDLVLAR